MQVLLDSIVVVITSMSCDAQLALVRMSGGILLVGKYPGGGEFVWGNSSRGMSVACCRITYSHWKFDTVAVAYLTCVQCAICK